jgi:hypothetical protein
VFAPIDDERKLAGRRQEGANYSAAPMSSPGPVHPYRSKTLAAWLALVGGALGLHRIYLHGPGDRLAWAHVPPTALGLLGVERLSTLGQDDRLAWLLLPWFGLMVSLGMLTAIVYALTPDERWDARYNAGLPARATRWAPVLAAIAALLIGGVVLIGTIAFSIQKVFEWQLEATPESTQR